MKEISTTKGDLLRKNMNDITNKTRGNNIFLIAGQVYKSARLQINIIPRGYRLSHAWLSLLTVKDKL